MSELKESKINSKIVYKGSFLDVRKDKVKLPNGNTGTREWIKHPGAVCMIPILPTGEIAFIRQYRYPVEQEMIELPAGKLAPNETPKICAHRELEEEIGYVAKSLKFITHIHPAIGFTNEVMYLYLAENLIQTKTNLDSDEFLVLKSIKLLDAVDMVWSREITDVKTVIGILWANKLLS